MTAATVRPPRAAVPPSPRVPAVLHLRRAKRDPAGFLRDVQSRAGDAASFRVGRRRVVFLNDPQLVHAVLVRQAASFSKAFTRGATQRIMGDSIFASDGEAHDRQRRMVQPLVRHAPFDEIAGRTYEDAADAVARWPRDGTVDARDEMQRLSLHVTVRNLCGASDEQAERALRGALPVTTHAYERATSPLRGVLDRLPLPSTQRIERELAALHAWADAQVEVRMAGAGGQGDDIFSQLVAQRLGDGGQERMSAKQLRDEMIDLLIGAHETVAAGLTFTLFLLAAHPEAQQRIRAEVDGALGTRAPTLGDLRSLAFTGRTVRESLRLFPPSWGFLRMAKEEVNLGNFRIPAGTVVVLCPAVTHRDPRYFPDPDRFDPDRWLPSSAGVAVKEAYFPFGAGARSCVGEPLALAEMTAVVAAVAARVHLRPVMAREPRTRPRMANSPDEPVPVHVEHTE